MAEVAGALRPTSPEAPVGLPSPQRALPPIPNEKRLPGKEVGKRRVTFGRRWRVTLGHLLTIRKHLVHAPASGTRGAVRDRVFACLEQPPERGRSVGARKAAGHAHDRHGRPATRPFLRLPMVPVSCRCRSILRKFGLFGLHERRSRIAPIGPPTAAIMRKTDLNCVCSKGGLSASSNRSSKSKASGVCALTPSVRDRLGRSKFGLRSAHPGRCGGICASGTPSAFDIRHRDVPAP